MSQQLILTQDGSHTIYNSEINEHYHSVNGAIAESKHVFIENGLNFCKSNPLHVLEIGFGTGLNALLALIESMSQKLTIYYDTIELYPLNSDFVSNLNYSKLTENNLENVFQAFHKQKWNTKIKINSFFTLHKIRGDAVEISFPDKYDVVFFDAFSPDKQPELWTKELFSKIFDSMNPDGILTTYCAKGIVKRALKEVGFTVQRIPGPPGKRHMVRALKI